LVTLLPHVLGPKHEQQQRPHDSKGFLKGAIGGDLGRDLRRGWQPSPWIAFWSL